MRKRLMDLFRRRKLEAEMAEEMRHHLEEQARRNAARGMPPAEAEHAARRQFGNVARIQQQAREGRAWFWLEQSVADLRFAARLLAKQRWFSLTAVLTLSVGIGASSAILGVIRAHVLDPVPGHDEDRLVEVYDESVFSRERGFIATSLYVGQQLKQMPEVFDQVSVFLPTGTEILEDGFYQHLRGTSVDGRFFGFLGTPPLLGRWLTEDDTRAGTRENIVISHRWWQSRFGGDPGVIGRQVRVREGGDAVRTIVGVMPAGFRFPLGDGEFWQPLSMNPKELAKPVSPNYRAFGRLAPGVTREKAQAALDVLHAALLRQFGSSAGTSFASPGETALRLRPVREFFVEPKVRRSVWVIATAAAVVLLIVCTNLALLQLARGEARRAEIAVRVALGAGRGRILRQLLAESLVLAAGGGLGGLLLAHGLRRLGDALLPAVAPVLQPAEIDGPALAWNLGIAALCGILFGFVPAWRAGEARPAQVLKHTAGTASNSARRRWFQRGLVAAQVALAMLLLCAAGLLARSMASLLKTDRGFDTAGLVEILPLVSTGEYRTPEHRAAVTRDLLDRFAALPGTSSATVSASGFGRRYYREGSDAPALLWQSFVAVGSTDYFRTLGLRLKAGRWFGPEDDRAGLKTVVLDAAAARALWPGESPVGKRFHADPGKGAESAGEGYEVIGVVENALFRSLESDPMRSCTIYAPFSRANGLGREFYLRTTLEPAALTAAVNRICRDALVGPRQPRVESIEERLSASIAPRRMMLWSALALAGTGLFLAMLGVFGVQWQAVLGRTREIGIRMALGAHQAGVMRLVLAEGLAVVLVGALAGAGGALWLSDALGGLLHGISPKDPLTFTLAPLLLAAVAVLACWLPAHRAAKVDPLVALKTE
ncbi:MAG TPA: ADOP family duplicated permease [Opitutaceae bacterium]|nr:ADOP family duplicated permease [Opitutaceae bacterium]